MSFSHLKCKMILMSLMIAVVSGLTVACATACIDQRKCLCKKAKKAFHQLENTLDV